MKQACFKIIGNEKIADKTYKLTLEGDASDSKVGGFVNIKIDGFYLRRPISICDATDNSLTLIYKTVGHGTEVLSEMKEGCLDILTGLGNGYKLDLSGEKPLLVGGGAGVPPLYFAAKQLAAQGKSVTAILGFGREKECFFVKEFEELGVKVIVTTVDGSVGIKGFVTDAMKALESDGVPTYSYFYACGPEAMLKAVCLNSKTEGELSFEERMGCGFGACMGCSCETITGSKRICRDGPVLKKSEILWKA